MKKVVINYNKSEFQYWITTLLISMDFKITEKKYSHQNNFCMFPVLVLNNY